MGRQTSNSDYIAQLKDERVQRMLLHWVHKDGKHRMPRDEAEELAEDILVKTVFKEVQQLQHACRAAGLQTPLQLCGESVVLLSEKEFIGHLIKQGKLTLPEPEPQIPPLTFWQAFK